MSDPRPEVLDFLLTRRSRPPKILTAPYPTQAEMGPILTAAARSPDHGKLEPWRFIVLEGAALQRLAELVEYRGGEMGEDPDKLIKPRDMFADAGLIVAVVSSPKPSPKVPEIEQVLSSGAVCLALVNAALASGWGASWLTGWMSTDRTFLKRGFALDKHEFIAGFIVIGTEKCAPPERPRPDLTKITEWVSE